VLAGIAANNTGGFAVDAVAPSIADLVATRDAHRRVRFGSIEPAIFTLLYQLDPLVAAGSLFACQLAQGQALSAGTIAGGLLTFLISSHVFGLPRKGDSEFRGMPYSTAWWRILRKWGCVAAILLCLTSAFRTTALFSRVTILSWLIVTPLALFAVHALRLWIRLIIANSTRSPRYIIIGANRVGIELFHRLPRQGFLGFFDFRSPERVAEVIDLGKLAGHCRNVADFARVHGVEAIYIALPISNVPRIGDLVRQLQDTTASIYFLPDLFAFDPIQGGLVEIKGLPALSVCDTPLHGMDAVFKRATDIVLAGLLLFLTLPLMLVIALAVKLSSPGPIFFRQRRYGLHGEEIIVYKFRSMTVCEDGSVVVQATKQDARVTRLGRILRKTSLDELPQLLNVLEGKMSLVGPRPHAVTHNEQYRRLIDGYMVRHKVRPGITGLAQVNGLRGETDTLEKMRERVKYDLEYLRHWSPWLDLSILLKTACVLVRERNAY
jgi:putative colanic acid biosynthesis UDP-glucose lipid carrier transferase